LHRDLVGGEGEELLPQPVVELAAPLGGEEGDDGGVAAEEGAAVTPDGVGGVGLDAGVGVAA